MFTLNYKLVSNKDYTTLQFNISDEVGTIDHFLVRKPKSINDDYEIYERSSDPKSMTKVASYNDPLRVRSYIEDRLLKLSDTDEVSRLIEFFIYS
jgi:hypothetical protein